MLKSRVLYLHLCLVIVAYLLCVGIRIPWIYWVKQQPESLHRGQLSAMTSDAYVYATILQKELLGVHQNNHLIWPKEAHGFITEVSYWLIKVFNFNLNEFILYYPIVLSGLLGLALYLISQLYFGKLCAFFIFVLSSVSYSYYCRSMAGYFDTDIFALSIPLYSIYFFIRFHHSRKYLHLILSCIILMLYPFFYARAAAFAFPMVVIILLILWLNPQRKLRKEAIFLYLISFIIMPIALYIKISAFSILCFVLIRRVKYRWSIILICVSLFLFTSVGSYHQLFFEKVKVYLNIENPENKSLIFDSMILQFKSDIKSISEAQNISFLLLTERVCGSLILFLIGVLGYIVFFFKFREGIVLLPYLGLGLFAMWGGLRFTLFAGPCIVIGQFFLVYELLRLLKNRYYIGFLSLGFLIIFAYPNVQKIIEYRPMVLVKESQIQALERMNKVSKEDAVVVSWWDYSNIVTYYSYRVSHLPFNSFFGQQSYEVAKLLSLPSDVAAAKGIRWAVENDQLLKYISSGGLDRIEKNWKYLEGISLEDIPKSSKETFLYLPIEMLYQFPTIYSFGNVDLKNGEVKGTPFFHLTRQKGFDLDRVYLENGMWIDRSRFDFFKSDGEKILIHTAHILRYDSKGELNVVSTHFEKSSNLHVIFIPYQDTYLFLDGDMLNSSFIQMYVFENYHRDYWKPIYMHPLAKIYQLKI